MLSTTHDSTNNLISLELPTRTWVYSRFKYSFESIFFRLLLDESSKTIPGSHWYIWNLCLAKESPWNPRPLSCYAGNPQTPPPKELQALLTQQLLEELWSPDPKAHLDGVQVFEKLKKREQLDLLMKLGNRFNNDKQNLFQSWKLVFILSFGKRWIMCSFWLIKTHFKKTRKFYQNNSHFHHHFPQKNIHFNILPDEDEMQPNLWQLAFLIH